MDLTGTDTVNKENEDISSPDTGGKRQKKPTTANKTREPLSEQKYGDDGKPKQEKRGRDGGSTPATLFAQAQAKAETVKEQDIIGYIMRADLNTYAAFAVANHYKAMTQLQDAGSITFYYVRMRMF